MQVYSQKLDNGLPILGINTGSFGSVTLLALVKVGSRYENSKMAGISHFLEHAVLKSIPSYPSPLELASAIEGVGGVSNAFTSREYMGFWIKLPVEHISLAAKILTETITKPLLKKEEIEREKGVIVEEINMYEDDPQRQIGDLYEQQLYDGPLGMDIAGTRETVKGFVRDDFTGWLNTYFHPNNALIVFAGNLYNEAWFGKQTREIQSYLNGWKQMAVPVPETVADEQNSPKLKVHFKKTQQVHLALGYRAFSYHDQRRYVLSVLSRLLGGGMSSRLFDEVREKRGLCYYIYTVKDHYADAGHITTYAGVNADVGKIRQALSVILKEHDSIAKGSVSDSEVRRVKEMIKGHILLSLEDSHTVASFFAAEQLLMGQYKTPEETIKAIDAVTKSDVVALARELFVPGHLNISLIGPVRKNELELGEILR